MDNFNIICNTKIEPEKLQTAQKIILELQNELKEKIKTGSGPFLAAIYDENGNLIAKAANSVVSENCSNNHAEMNTIKLTQEKLKTFDLSKYNLSIYITAEPCIMCLGGIMWSGIKNVFYGVKSCDVEKITGFDEGFKPNWHEEFAKRNIFVCGNICKNEGVEVLKTYINQGNTVYKPQR